MNADARHDAVSFDLLQDLLQGLPREPEMRHDAGRESGHEVAPTFLACDDSPVVSLLDGWFLA
ncbi:MAG: hypothetical protein RLZZ592_1772 [Pseudomonadota bacterium]|jgi:hypothetical protein